jgi:DNA-binding NarL/FixJ family response regulator
MYYGHMSSTQHVKFGDPTGCEPWLVVVRLPDAEPLSAFRPSERAVAEAIVDGLSNAEIARTRGTSQRTVANQVASLFQQLEVQSRAELVRRVLGGELSS